MIDVAANNAVYYYHYDGLGSVVALSDSDGDSVQSYEYSVYGKVAAKAIVPSAKCGSPGYTALTTL